MRRHLLVLVLCGSAGCAHFAAAGPGSGGDGSGGIPVTNGNAGALQPLEESRAPFPSAAGEPHPEGINTTTGSNADFAFAFGSGYVHAPLTDVLAALRQPEVVLDHRRVDEWQLDRGLDQLATGFRIHNVVHGIITVDFDTTWVQAVTSGTAAAPKTACIRATTKSNTRFIHLIEDSIVGKAIDAQTTALEFVRHLNGFMVGPKDAEQWVKDIFANVVAKVHGRPVPKYK